MMESSDVRIGEGVQIGRRSLLVASAFEFGSWWRAWRLLDIFREFSNDISVLGVTRGLERHPPRARACVERGLTSDR
jgi:hypothetical protein